MKQTDESRIGHEMAERYAAYKRRYGSALKAGCYLECVLIDYAMMEDRLVSILHHLNIADRNLGEGCRWAQSPKPRKEGYRAALASLRTDGGALPNLKNISTKADVLGALATLGDPDEDCGEFEVWLRTDVRSKLVECGAVDLCAELHAWRNRRNDLTHNLFGPKASDYDAEALRELAVEGMDLAKRLDNISGRMATLMRRYEKRRSKRKV